MKNSKKILLVALIACISLGGSYAYAEEAETESSATETTKPSEAPKKNAEPLKAPAQPTDNEAKVYDYQYKLNYRSKDGKVINIPGATLVFTNNKTNKTIELETKDGLADFKLPDGDYTVSVKSVPDEYKEKVDTSKTKSLWGHTNGWNVLTLDEIDPNPQPKPEITESNFGVGFTFRPLTNRTGLHDSVEQIGVVITLTNKKTGEVYTYTTDGKGAHRHIPVGEYTMHLESVPESIRGRFEIPKDKDITVYGISQYDGFNVEEIEKPQPKPEDKPDDKPSDYNNYDIFIPTIDEKEEKKEEEPKDGRSDEELIADIEKTDKEINDVLDKNEEKKKEENKEKENKEEDKKPEKEEANPEKGKKDKKAAPAKNSNPKTGVASLGYLGGLAAVSLAGLLGTKKRK